MEIPVNAALIKITGVFSYNPKKDPVRFISNGYKTMQMVDLPMTFLAAAGEKGRKEATDKTRSFYKNTYYAEFRDLMFTGRDPKDQEGLQKKQINKLQNDNPLAGTFIHPKYELPFQTIQQELFLFPDGIGIFAISLDARNKTLTEISNLINLSRSFDSPLKNDIQEPIIFHKWISVNVLGGISIVGENLEVDEYSGSKFKIYSVLDLPTSEGKRLYNREHLLYEIGTSSPIGTIEGTGRLKPSEDYYKSTLQFKLSAFDNYEGLSLLDSFTVIGTGNYMNLTEGNADYYSHHSWNRTYFAIYVFNLYVRYNLFKFNTEFLTNPIKYREKFQDFLNNYNFAYISFNFLPNLIFAKMRGSLGIDIEIDKFEKRLSNLAASIQESQEKRQAFLLTLISIISSYSAAKDIFDSVKSAQDWLGWSNVVFYSSLTIIITCIGVILFKFLFPIQAQKLGKKWRKFWEMPTKNKVL